MILIKVLFDKKIKGFYHELVAYQIGDVEDTIIGLVGNGLAVPFGARTEESQLIGNVAVAASTRVQNEQIDG